MDTLAHPIIALYGLSNGILATGIGDLSDQDARARSRGGTGPSADVVTIDTFLSGGGSCFKNAS